MESLPFGCFYRCDVFNFIYLDMLLYTLCMMSVEVPLRPIFLRKLYLSNVPPDAELMLAGQKVCDLEKESVVDFTEIYAEIYRKEWRFSLMSDEEKLYKSEGYRLTPVELMFLVINDCPSSTEGPLPDEPDMTFSGLNLRRCQRFDQTLVITSEHPLGDITYRYEMQ